jgi:hypothetical protein
MSIDRTSKLFRVDVECIMNGRGARKFAPLLALASPDAAMSPWDYSVVGHVTELAAAHDRLGRRRRDTNQPNRAACRLGDPSFSRKIRHFEKMADS